MKSDIVEKFEKIYQGESDALFRFCLVRVSNREQARDLTQETFLRFWQSLQEEKIENVRAFLFTVAHRLIIDWYRKKKSLSLEGILAKKEEYEHNLIDENSKDNLGIAPEGRFLVEKINELSPTNRDPIYLRFVEGLSPGEIGTILGISANAASVRVNRGLVELRELTGYDEEDFK